MYEEHSDGSECFHEGEQGEDKLFVTAVIEQPTQHGAQRVAQTGGGEREGHATGRCVVDKSQMNQGQAHQGRGQTLK